MLRYSIKEETCLYNRGVKLTSSRQYHMTYLGFFPFTNLGMDMGMANTWRIRPVSREFDSPTLYLYLIKCSNVKNCMVGTFSALASLSSVHHLCYQIFLQFLTSSKFYPQGNCQNRNGNGKYIFYLSFLLGNARTFIQSATLLSLGIYEKYKNPYHPTEYLSDSFLIHLFFPPI